MADKTLDDLEAFAREWERADCTEPWKGYNGVRPAAILAVVAELRAHHERVPKLERVAEAGRPVLAITDRKHDRWDDLKAAYAALDGVPFSPEEVLREIPESWINRHIFRADYVNWLCRHCLGFWSCADNELVIRHMEEAHADILDGDLPATFKDREWLERRPRGAIH